ncbi:MAG: S46 family peptidase [Rhabdochlamydiaceae bacterium]|nr:S46 family peptidase [Rhabdochlamydiaceae bacterium]
MKGKWLLSLSAVLCMFSLYGEEGMWPFSQVPKKKIAKTYGVEIDDQWLSQVQKSALRFSTGGSASFISSQGLVMTNHHVGARVIHNLSSSKQNYLEEGFYAKLQEDELLCPNLYVDQLLAISDVTEEVQSRIASNLSFAEKEQAQKEICAEIQKKAFKDTGLQPEVVILYHGAKYHLYLYKRYTDVRLVMAPDSHVASMGGDIDNFEFPRYSLDVCFFRIYEEGKPVHPESYFSWSSSGPQEGELLFVVGHPGKTRRMLTSDHLRFCQEVEIPMISHFLEDRLEKIAAFAKRGKEQERISSQERHSLANAYKVYQGLKKSFQNASPIALKQKKEAAFSKYSQKPRNLVKSSLEDSKSYVQSHFVLEGFGSNYSKLYGLAKTLVRMSEELKLPNEKRLPEYVDTELSKCEMKILSEEPFYPEWETMCLEAGLENLRSVLGASHPLMQQILQDASPQKTAKKIMESTSLYDLKTRSLLYKNPDRVISSLDPLLLLAKAVDVYARQVRKVKEETLDPLQRECYTSIAEQEFDLYGDAVYPDATFTLRLSLGQMKGYEEKKKFIQPFTTWGGMYEHVKKHGFEKPYHLLFPWIAAQDSISKKVPLNFVSTHDIIGGNSGSPVINAQREWVGIIFDGNAHSIAWSYQFEEEKGRAISVHSQGIVEALQSVYHADRLVKEIQGCIQP